jgi:cell wall-associated NlpC family hydrolase
MVRSSLKDGRVSERKSCDATLAGTMRHVTTQFLIAFFASAPLFAGPLIQSGAPASSAISSSQEQEVAARRAEFMAIAERYRTLEWRASESNRLHGKDADGVSVDTPDDSFRDDGWVPGEVNVGMPYRWGGFDTPESFLAGIAEGRFGGQIPANNGQGSPPASSRAVGVDCSGFVSRCWDLPNKRSTRSFAPLVYELDSFDDLLPGDLINNHDGHAVLFEKFADDDHSRVIVIEATFPKVKRTTYVLNRLRSANMRPMRYKPLDSRWIRVERADESFTVGAMQEPGVFVRDKELEAPEDPMALRIQPSDWQAGSWARYTTNESMSNGGSQATLMVTLGDDSRTPSSIPCAPLHSL